MASIWTDAFSNSSNLHNLSCSLGNPSVNDLSIRGGPITHEEASLIYTLLRHDPDKRWNLTLQSCYPAGDDSIRDRLRKALSSTKIETLCVFEMDTVHSKGQKEMMECLFGSTPPSSDASTIDELVLSECVFGDDCVPQAKEWVRRVQVREFRFERNFEYYQDKSSTVTGGVTSFLAGIYEGSKLKPGTLTMEFTSMKYCGDLSLLQSWGDKPKSLDLFQAYSSQDIPVSGLVKGLASLSRLQSLTYSVLEPDALDALARLLRSEHCGLRKLDLRTPNISKDSAVALLGALGSNNSVKCLSFRPMHNNEHAIEALLHLLEKSKSLKRLSFDGNMFRSNFPLVRRVTELLKTTNSDLEAITSYNGQPISSSLMPLGFRNLAGRRLLSQQHSIPAGLWPHVLGRIRNLSLNGYDDDDDDIVHVNDKMLQRWRVDSMYFLLQEGCISSITNNSNNDYHHHQPTRKRRIGA